MFQNAFHVVLYNNCGINIKVGVLFEQVIIQEIVTHLTLSCL
jgi:hypothetical protein